MNDSMQSGETRAWAGEAQAAEATLLTQPEDHTMPAGQVFDEQRQQRDGAGRGVASLLLVP
jgi:hypothetical protein